MKGVKGVKGEKGAGLVWRVPPLWWSVGSGNA